MHQEKKKTLLYNLTSKDLNLLQHWISVAEEIKKMPLATTAKQQALEPLETMLRGSILNLAVRAQITPEELTKAEQAISTYEANESQKAALRAASGRSAAPGSFFGIATPATRKRKSRIWY